MWRRAHLSTPAPEHPEQEGNALWWITGGVQLHGEGMAFVRSLFLVGGPCLELLIHAANSHGLRTLIVVGLTSRYNQPQLDLPRLPARAARTHEQEKDYTFKRVFGSEATQEMVFEGAALPLVDGVCDGLHNSLLVMYGMSGGGKTHTTVGTKTDMGLLPRALT